MTKINLKQVDKQIAALGKSATLLRRELNKLYRRYDHSTDDVTDLEKEIGVLEARVERIQKITEKFAEDGMSFI